MHPDAPEKCSGACLEHSLLMTREVAEKLLDLCWSPRAGRSEQARYRAATRFAMYNRMMSYCVGIIGW
jgi:hypothetical protein